MPELDTANWRVVYNGHLYDCFSALATDTFVAAQFSIGDVTLAANSWSYLPPPYDVVDRDGEPAPTVTAAAYEIA